MTDHERPEDRELRALLQRHTARPPFDEVDWSKLHARITTAAAPRFSQPQRTLWWQQVADWSPRGIPLAAAAAAVLAIVLGTGVVRTVPTDRVPAPSAFLTLEEELAADAPLFLAASDDAEAVIDVLLLQEMED